MNGFSLGPDIEAADRLLPGRSYHQLEISHSQTNGRCG